MKLHFSTQPLNSNNKLAKLTILVDCRKDEIYTIAEAINNYADLQEVIEYVGYHYMIEQGVIIAYTSAIFATDSIAREREYSKIKSVVELICSPEK